MREYIKNIPNMLKRELSSNILIIGMLFYFLIISVVRLEPGCALLAVVSAVIYVAGAALGKIRKYIPMGMSVISVVILSVALCCSVFTGTVSSEITCFSAAVLLFSTVGFVCTNGTKCVPYCLSMLAGEAVLCIDGGGNGIVIMIATVLLAGFFANATYTSMSKYVLSVFLGLAIIKVTGIICMLRGEMMQGLMDVLVKNAVLYVAMVVLGIASLLLRERHPRIKSDRDKKPIPVLKQWQTVFGLTVLVLFIWGIFSFSDVFAIHTGTMTQSVRMILVYTMLYFDTSRGVLLAVMEKYDLLVLFLLTAAMGTLIYKAFMKFKATELFADRLLLLLMIGFFVCFMWLDMSILAVLFYSLLAGCIVNGE